MSWWVRNVRDMRWRANELGSTVDFDAGVGRFGELGINLTVLEPGQPMTMYHRERYQEGFLLLRGECLLGAGSRVGPDIILYPRDETALRHGAGVEQVTPSPKEAYAKFTRPTPPTDFREEFLTG